ncbi:MAG TPA: glycosyltransferase [Opitutus sp.]|nr:glycosyltransferase [Opitutus sp.]
MNRRVLIVAPHFAPISAPDGQRVRMLLPHLREFGWEPHVLSVDPTATEAPLEPALLRTLPADVPVTRVSAWPSRLTRRVGLGNIAWRAWTALRAAGDALLREQHFDLVYFSTTQFACLPLGRIWQRRHGVPFVVDLQDPWRSDFAHSPGVRPPGGWKYRFAALQARWLEPWTLRRCAGVVAVSPAYLEQLADRYPWWKAERGCMLPMGWSERDFAFAPTAATGRAEGAVVIRYLGRLGPDLTGSLKVFLAGFARARRETAKSGLTAEFYGGSYDPRVTAGPVHVLAEELGIEAAISEHAARIPYLDSLALLRAADANLILGSQDDGYAPSKAWLVLASGKPWLALARAGSVLHRMLSPHTGLGGRLIDPDALDAVAEVAAFCRSLPGLRSGASDPARLASLEARELARQHAGFFAKLLAR